MSIYLHFADKQALLNAVIADVFAELDAAMVAAAAGADDPLGALCAQASAYIQFAIEHPGHYRYAMMEHRASADREKQVDEIRTPIYKHFAAVVAACVDAGAFAQADPHTVALEIWTAVHGIAALVIAKPALPWGDKMSFANRRCDRQRLATPRPQRKQQHAPRSMSTFDGSGRTHGESRGRRRKN
jgi:AcrR family transcriptional regulator